MSSWLLCALASRISPRSIPADFFLKAGPLFDFVFEQCPRGTPVAVACDPGYYSNWTDLSSKEECDICPRGKWCAAGTSVPDDCAAGRYGATPAQSSRECTGPCLVGHYCKKGSTTNTSGVCRARRNTRSTVFAVGANAAGQKDYHVDLLRPLTHVTAAGRYNPDIGRVHLLDCILTPRGKYTAIAGAAEAISCSPGVLRPHHT